MTIDAIQEKSPARWHWLGLPPSYVRVWVDERNQVHVTSECWWPMTFIDWGKNRWNVRRVLANMTLILGAPY